MKKKDLAAIKALRFQHATNQLDNPMRIASVRKEIAVVMTVLNEKKNA